jgi:coenzyme F420-0:L-glutamate ligase/coenzyme F420-1:gamma-L-glutamate ligase
MDLRGRSDLFGHELRVTETGFADEIASAASLIMGQADEAQPVVLVRGLSWTGASTTGESLIRPPDEDLFR